MAIDRSAALVIPAYNEASRIMRVLEPALDAPSLKDIIVVDDGSTDGTHKIAEDYGVTVLRHDERFGKGEALDTGMSMVQDYGYEAAVFLDGDLRGLQAHHIEELLHPINEDGAWMSIGYLGLRKSVVKKAVLNRWGAFSGQRAIRTEVWDFLNSRDKHGFNVEAALNARLRKHGLHNTIARVALDGVGHVGKRQKEDSWAKAAVAYAKTYGAAMWTYARIELEQSGA